MKRKANDLPGCTIPCGVDLGFDNSIGALVAYSRIHRGEPHSDGSVSTFISSANYCLALYPRDIVHPESPACSVGIAYGAFQAPTRRVFANPR